MVSLVILLVFTALINHSLATKKISSKISAKVIQRNNKYNEISNQLLTRYEKRNLKLDVDAEIAMKQLQTTLNNYNDFQNSIDSIKDRDSIRNGRAAVLMFNTYCGPGARGLNPLFSINDEKAFSAIDSCCRLHDLCPNYVSESSDYKNFPGLPRQQQYFSR